MIEFSLKIEEAVSFLKKRTDNISARVGIILGSGLGGLVEQLDNRIDIETSDVPHWPVSTVEGHRGRVVLGILRGNPILILQGRIHYYEGYPVQEVVFPIRVIAKMGIQYLILTNAAGAVNPEFQPGDLMVITDHINLMGVNPLIGINEPASGPRFPDMSAPYNKNLITIAQQAARKLGFSLRKGVLAATSGPSYETCAEIRMMKILGADAVCMSTVPEVIAGVQLGLKIIGISCITNMATGLSSGKLDHQEVKETAMRIQDKFVPFVKILLNQIHEYSC